MSAPDVFRNQRAVTRAEKARERLSGRFLPGGERSWIDLAVEAARAAGCSVDDILGDARYVASVRGRHAWWAAIRREGYSYPEIAAGAGVDASTVLAALKKLGARGDGRGCPPVGFAGMGLGAGI